MDKNMINIDDLFRQRLGGGEEEERAGAWLQMRGLLDEKMPVGVVNWRRMLMYAGGLVLLAAIGVGGYEISSSTRNTADASLSVSGKNTDKQSPIAINSNKLVSGNDQPGANKTNNTNNNSSSNNNNNNNNTIAAAVPAAHNTTNTTTSPTTSTTTNALNNSSTNEKKNNANNTVANSNTTGTQPVDIKAGKNDVLASADLANNKKQSQQQTPATNKKVVPYSAANTVANNHKKHATGINTTTPSPVVHNKKHTDNKGIIPASGNNGTVSMTPLAQHAAGQKKADKTTNYILKDSIEKVVVQQHFIIDPLTRTATYRVDTIGVSKMPRFVIAPLEKEVVVADNKKVLQNNVPGQANKSATNKTNQLLPAAKLNEQKTSAVADNATAATETKNLNKHNKAGWDWSVLGQALRDFEYNMGKVRVYPGLIGGINKTFGSNPNSGFQAGLTTEFVVNDQMSIMTELKYMQRFNGGLINNDYTVNNGKFISPVWLVTTNSYHHSFNYSTMNSIELPIAIRYKTGNFYIYAGGNLVYNFAIDATESLSTLTRSEQATYTTSTNWKAETPKMNISDFGSRFGIGYLFGASYEFTPSIMIDARVTRTFWDNSQTNGAKQITDLLYKGPSTQLSIIYRLNHQKPETVSPRY